MPIYPPGEVYSPNMTQSVVSEACCQHSCSLHKLHDPWKRNSTRQRKRRTTGILMRTSFLKIGVLESKSEAEMPIPTPHHRRVPFHARIACSCHKISTNVCKIKERCSHIWQGVRRVIVRKHMTMTKVSEHSFDSVTITDRAGDS